MQTNSALLEGEPSSWRSAVLKHRKGPRVQGSKGPIPTARGSFDCRIPPGRPGSPAQLAPTKRGLALRRRSKLDLRATILTPRSGYRLTVNFRARLLEPQAGAQFGTGRLASYERRQT